MIDYNLNLVRKTMEEACKKFVLSKNIIIKDIQHNKSKAYYLVTLDNGEKRIVPQELVNRYIESLGNDGDLEIAGHLMHSIELEKDKWIQPEWSSPLDTEEVWEGDIKDVLDYIQDKEENPEEDN